MTHQDLNLIVLYTHSLRLLFLLFFHTILLLLLALLSSASKVIFAYFLFHYFFLLFYYFRSFSLSFFVFALKTVILFDNLIVSKRLPSVEHTPFLLFFLAFAFISFLLVLLLLVRQLQTHLDIWKEFNFHCSPTLTWTLHNFEKKFFLLFTLKMKH